MNSTSRPKYFPFLDLVRGLAALAVAIDHGMWFRTLSVPGGEQVLKASKVLVNAPAAVLVFFVVSGFCIHLPNLDRPFSKGAFLTRRFLRLGLPFAGASIVAYLVGFRWFHIPFGQAVIWSLACEAIYYVMYAVVAPRMNRRRWICACAGSFLIAVAVAIYGRDIVEYPRRSLWEVTLMGLPIWISGVLVAEHCGRVNLGSRLVDVALWMGVLLGGGVATVLKFKWGVSYGITLTFYGLLVAPWLWQSLRFPAWRVLRFLGVVSYSLYLLHQPLIPALQSWADGLGLPGLLPDLVVMAGVLACSVAFYFAVELPGHRFARFASRRPFLNRRVED